MRLNATRRPPASHTATLMRMFNSRALAMAACTTWLASLSVRGMWRLLQDVVHRGLDVVPARQCGLLERWAVGHGDRHRTHPPDGGLQRPERVAVLDDQRGDLRGGRAGGRRLVHDDQPPRLLHGLA